jgi:hypothetical protein
LCFQHLNNNLLFLDEESSDDFFFDALVAQDATVCAFHSLLAPAQAGAFLGARGKDSSKLVLALTTPGDLLGFFKILVYQFATRRADATTKNKKT